MYLRRSSDSGYEIAAVFIKLILFLNALIFFHPIAGLSATFTEMDDEIFHCKFLMEGVIRKGDLQKLEAVLDSRKIVTYPPPNNYFPDRLCLNSPGGSLVEAVKMANLLKGRGGTAIRSGDRCESACAIIFMAGSFALETGEEIATDRVMHPLAKLGFHTPFLQVEDGQYSKESVEKAYYVATRSLGQLFELSSLIDMPATLLTEMLNTPQNDMMYVDKVWQATRWDIAIAPAKKPPELNRKTLVDACNNVFERDVEVFLDTKGRVITYDERALWEGIGEPKISRDNQFLSVEFSGFGYLLSGDLCHISFPKDINRFELITSTMPLVSAGISTQGAFPTRPTILFPGQMKISDLNPTNLDLISLNANPIRELQTLSMIEFKGYDLAGGDILVERGINQSRCEKRCKQNGECDAFTYDRWNKICILKNTEKSMRILYLQPKTNSSIIEESADTIVNSKADVTFKRRDGRYFPSGSYLSVNLYSRDQCQFNCSAENKCHAYDFNLSTKLCQMYNLPPEYFPKRGSVIGIKEQH